MQAAERAHARKGRGGAAASAQRNGPAAAASLRVAVVGWRLGFLGGLFWVRNLKIVLHITSTVFVISFIVLF